MPSLMLNGRNYSGGGGGGGSSIQVDTMSTPTSSDLNKIVQYVGTTTSSYINGYFYKCIFDDPNYVWEEIQVSEGKTTLAALEDTNILSPSADQVISFNASTQKWVNTTLEDGKIYKYTFSSVSSLPTTVNFTNGNGDLEVTHSYITNPSALTGDLTITTAARVGGGCSVTLSGTISGTTDISIQFVKPISLTVAS